MAEQKNPYAAPSAPIADFHAPQTRGVFIREGQSVPAGQGWTWWRQGFAIFRASPWMWMLMVVVLMGVFLAAGAVLGAIGFSMMRSPSVLILVSGVMGLALSIVYPIFEGGLMLAARDTDEAEGPTVGHLFAGFSQSAGTLATVGGLLLVGNIVIQVVVGAVFGMGFTKGAAGDPGAMIQQGALVFLIYLALTIPLMMAFWFAPALVVFNGLSAIDAMRSSFVGCLKNIVPFLIYGLVGLGFGILLGLLLGILIAVTRGLAIILMLAVLLSIVPIILGSIYSGYRDIYTARS